MLTPNASCTLYLQTGPGAYTRVYVPACFWQDGEDGVSIVIPGELPEQYKGEKREKDYVVQGERMGEVTDTQSKRELTGSSSKTARASLFPGTAFLLSQFPPQTAPLQTGTKISNMVSTKFRAP